MTPIRMQVLLDWATRLESGQEPLTPISAALRQRDRGDQLASAQRLRAKAGELRAILDDTPGRDG